MNCRDIDKLLTAYLEGALTLAEKERVQSHLDSCPRCRGELEALAATRNRLTQALRMAASAATPPPDSWEQISRRAGIEAGTPSPKKSSLSWLATPVSVLLLIILLAGVFFMGGMAQPPPDPPALVADDNDGAFLFWLDTPSDYGDGVYAQHIDAVGNLLWGEGGRLLADEHDVFSGVPLAVGDGAGGIIIAWGDEEGISVQRLDAEGNNIWDDSVLVWAKPAGGWHSLVGMVADGEGGAVLLREGSGEMVYAQRVSADGSLLWGEGGTYIGKIQRAYQGVPMVGDGSGGAVLLWEDSSVRWIELYAQRISPDGESLWGSGGVLVSTRDSEKDRPQLVNDGTGGFIATWTDISTESWDTKIYAQKLDAEGQRMWGEQGVCVCADSGLQSDPQITADGAGGCVIVISWWDIYLTGAGGIVAQRLSPDGRRLWGGGVLLYTVSEGSPGSGIGDIYVSGDGNGNSLVIWKGGEGVLCAQKLDADGQRLWTENGVEIYSGAPLRAVGYSSLISGGSGGFIIASRVSRGSSVSNTDSVYAQRIDSDGNRLWGESGLEVQPKPSSPILLIIAVVVILVAILILYGVFRRSRAAGTFSVVAPVLIAVTALVAKVLLFFPLGYSYGWAYILHTPLNFLSVAVIPVAGLAIAAVGVGKKTATRWLLVPILVFSVLVAFIIEFIVVASFP